MLYFITNSLRCCDCVGLVECYRWGTEHVYNVVDLQQTGRLDFEFLASCRNILDRADVSPQFMSPGVNLPPLSIDFVCFHAAFALFLGPLCHWMFYCLSGSSVRLTVVLLFKEFSVQFQNFRLIFGLKVAALFSPPLSFSRSGKRCQLSRKDGVTSRKAAAADPLQTDEGMDSKWVTSRRSLQQLIQES